MRCPSCNKFVPFDTDVALADYERTLADARGRVEYLEKELAKRRQEHDAILEAKS